MAVVKRKTTGAAAAAKRSKPTKARTTGKSKTAKPKKRVKRTTAGGWGFAKKPKSNTESVEDKPRVWGTREKSISVTLPTFDSALAAERMHEGYKNNMDRMNRWGKYMSDTASSGNQALYSSALNSGLIKQLEKADCRTKTELLRLLKEAENCNNTEEAQAVRVRGEFREDFGGGGKPRLKKAGIKAKKAGAKAKKAGTKAKAKKAGTKAKK
jgi:hypothetical protein